MPIKRACAGVPYQNEFTKINANVKSHKIIGDTLTQVDENEATLAELRSI